MEMSTTIYTSKIILIKYETVMMTFIFLLGKCFWSLVGNGSGGIFQNIVLSLEISHAPKKIKSVVIQL